ncbi:putative bifunctional diguanylate cyclase/phosphodiesterase [Duganella aceris]|nr:bifunctional diguanylate cyclase/phosphodiesterase [Duganella aceris]
MSGATDDAYEGLIQFLYMSPVGLVQLQSDGQVELINPMSAQLLMPLARGDLDNLFTVLEPYAPELRRLCAEFGARQGVICEAMRIALPEGAGGPNAPQFLSLGLMRVDGGRIMASLVDATNDVQREERTLARRLDSVARTDTLTQLPNRAAVHELLQRMAARPRGAGGDHGALMFINVDRFKQINDTWGNAVGDQAICLMADRLRAALRSDSRRGEPEAHGAEDDAHGGAAGGRHVGARDARDARDARNARDAHEALGAVPARVAGDEFAVLLDGLESPAVAERVAERLLQALGRPYRIGPHEIVCTFSIGLVALSDAPSGPAPTADEVLRDAGIALVAAKAEGGGRCVLFAPEMRERAARRGGVEAELRLALDRGELFTVYQPVVGILPDGGIDRSTGVEALVRWQHPVRGLVGPVEFIEIAEECGLIGAIGEHVLRTACRDFMHWRAELGALAPRLLAVNLSRAQLAQRDLCESVHKVLLACAMRPEQLQLEITESLAAQGADIQSQLQRLKRLGVKLALDDFGTGYSSLSSLHLLPVDTVKIDRSFVSLADTSAHHEVLIEATVKVARSLGMNTVAEGIETEAQAAVVRRQGCDKGQGYLYSRPLHSDRLIEWLRAGVL